MPLLPLELDIVADAIIPLSDEAQAQIAAARAAVAELERDQPQVARLLLLSDAVAFSAGLKTLRRHQCLRGRRFCEWGSGIGLMTALAALEGFDAVGIEAEPVLVNAAQKAFPQAVRGPRFMEGSFVPVAAAERFRVVGTYGATVWEPSLDPDPYAALGLDCAEIDLVYAYPWPREIPLYETLFAQCASPGALLWLYVHGGPPRLLRQSPER